MTRKTGMIPFIAVVAAIAAAPAAWAGAAGGRGPSAEEVVTRAGTSAWAARSLSQRDLDRLGKLISKTSERAADQLTPSGAIVKAGTDAWSARGLSERDLSWLGNLISGAMCATAPRAPESARPSRGPMQRGPAGRGTEQPLPSSLGS